MPKNKKGAARQGTPPKSNTPDDTRLADTMREVADASRRSEYSATRHSASPPCQCRACRLLTALADIRRAEIMHALLALAEGAA